MNKLAGLREYWFLSCRGSPACVHARLSGGTGLSVDGVDGAVGDQVVEDFIELSHLIAPPEVVAAERAALLAKVAVGATTFRLAGGRLTMRWEETWGGPQSREVACADVERLNAEADDRSAGGQQTWKVVMWLRGGETIVPVRRWEKGGCDEAVAKLSRMLGLTSLPKLPTLSEDLPGGEYVSMCESGMGMRPIIEGGGTLIGASEEGGVLLRYGDGPPWLLVGADRSRLWARAVGVPAGWGADRDVGREWAVSGISRVRDVPMARGEPGAAPGWSDVWVEMRDDERVRVARHLPEAEAVAVAAALTRAIALPTQWGRSRAYLNERAVETLGPGAGASGGGLGDSDAMTDRSAGTGGATVLSYSREAAGTMEIIRGDGVLRITVPPAPFWRAWIGYAAGSFPQAARLVITFLLLLGLSELMFSVRAFMAAWAVLLLWLGASALTAWSARTELSVTDGTLRVEHRGFFGRRRRQWPLEDVLSVEEALVPWSVTALVREPTGGGEVRQTQARLLMWVDHLERRRLLAILRAAVGLGPADAGK